MNREFEVHLPEFVLKIIARIESAGFLAYAVGGCVRDSVLGVEPDDYDVSTSALPDDIAGLFSETVPVGRQFGTIGVKCKKQIVEVTTFRRDGEYLGHRRPESVDYSSDLTEDLSRRDFTINAMAYNPKSGIIDPFCGIDDIKSSLVRAVGEPSTRFEEDALRMLRAFRFAAKTGFEIESGTLDAILQKSRLISHISAERVRDELIKILYSKNPQYALRAVSVGLLDPYFKRSGNNNGKNIDEGGLVGIAPGIPSLCAFLAVLKQNGRIDCVKEFLNSLKFDGATLKLAADALNVKLEAADRVKIKAEMSTYGEKAVRTAALSGNDLEAERMIRDIIEKGEPFKLDQLAVNGDDLTQLGISGKQVGALLSRMLDYVIRFPERNKKPLLLSNIHQFQHE